MLTHFKPKGVCLSGSYDAFVSLDTKKKNNSIRRQRNVLRFSVLRLFNALRGLYESWSHFTDENKFARICPK